MTKNEKIQILLNKLDTLEQKRKVRIAADNDDIAQGVEQLINERANGAGETGIGALGALGFQSIRNMRADIMKLKKDPRINKIITAFTKADEEYAKRHDNLKKEFSNEINVIRSELKAANTSSAELTNTKSIEFAERIEALENRFEMRRTALANTDALIKAEVSRVWDELARINGGVDTVIERFEDENEQNKNAIREVNDALDDLSASVSQRIANIGAGNANRNIALNGNTSMLSRFTDVNLIAGTGVSLSYSPNQTTKYTDITLSVGAIGVTSLLSGTVDGSNQSFTFSTAPNVICVDQGRFMQRVSSDGTVNWTIVGTTATVTVAPTFDIFAL